MLRVAFWGFTDKHPVASQWKPNEGHQTYQSYTTETCPVNTHKHGELVNMLVSSCAAWNAIAGYKRGARQTGLSLDSTRRAVEKKKILFLCCCWHLSARLQRPSILLALVLSGILTLCETLELLHGCRASTDIRAQRFPVWVNCPFTEWPLKPP